jgi:hypothetical protein
VIEYYISQCMSVCDRLLYLSVYEGGSVCDMSVCDRIPYQSVYECM